MDLATRSPAHASPGASAESRMQALVERLRDPRCYPHPVQAVEVLQTHISYVLLAGEFAYKLKKPVRLPFLDFSTPEARRRYCEEELRLNRRTAPDLYVDVVTIGGREPNVRVGGADPVLEHAVRMRRFAQTDLFDARARAERLGAAEIDALAERVAAFHAAAACAPPDSGFGSPESITGPALDNFRVIEGLDPALGNALAQLRLWTRLQGDALGARFAERAAGACVRECHGDLHLGNVVLVDGAPVLFDGIEFDERLRWIDVMSDVAFAVMDLVHHGLTRLAFRFLDRYLERSGDYAGLAVLRYYMVYRAMVRAKVACIRKHQAEAGAAGRAEAAAAMESYLRLAERLARPAAPVLVLMHGLSGSGKTTAAQRLLERLGGVRVRSDVERKRLQGLDALARTGAGVGEGPYSQQETERTYERLAMLARTVLEAGYPVVVDATFLKRTQREAFRQVARAAGAAFQVASCRAPHPVLRGRIARRALEARDASEAGLEVLEAQILALEPLDEESRRHALLLDMETDYEWQRAVDSFARRFRLPGL